MKNLTPFMILSSLVVGVSLNANEGPVCHQCEKIREYNAAHPEKNYYWYDDYLKDQEKECKTPDTKKTSLDDKAPLKEKTSTK